MKKFWFAILTLGLALNIGAFACSSDDDDNDNDDNDDGATDADTDADSDADADADSDSDGDCAINSGWPCTCDGSAATCNDGADCIGVTDVGTGTYCAAQCTGQGGTCPATAYAATGQCALSDGGTNFWCVLVCTDVSQCPPDQSCLSAGSASVCLP